jgi:uncharacterized protein (TIGR03790 family)
MHRILFRSIAMGLGLLAWPGMGLAVGPQDVFVLTNKNVPASRSLGEHYCQKRGVPLDHILVFDLPTEEDMSRQTYDERLAVPLRALLKDRKEQAKVLLSMYGIPLRVGPQTPSPKEKTEHDTMRQQLEPLRARQRELNDKIKVLYDQAGKDAKSDAARALPLRKKELADLEMQIRAVEDRCRWLSYSESNAAVDSELALLWHPGYELRRWQLNLLYFQVSDEVRQAKPPLVMTARLDGPSVDLVKRLIDQAVETEAKGLMGKVYVDARGIKYNPGGGWGYDGYDESLREMARLLQDQAKLSVTLDDKPELFPPGSCTDCALYCGWYSHGKFVDCCRFVPGAVAYHIASSEAVSLRDPKAPYWCKNLLEHGAVATLGPVAEPYTIGFPKPAEFFGFLVTGEYTLVECYWRTSLFASWMTVLVGDPLYNPYAKMPKLKSTQVKPSPRGGSFKVITNGK